MPPIRTGRTRSGDRNAQTNMQVSAAIFRHFTNAQLRELCQSNGLSAQGRRTVLEKRLKDAGIAQTAHSTEQIADRSTSTRTVQQRASPAAFTEEQISEIKRLIQDSVASASRDIAREAACAAAEAMQSQVPSSSPSPSPQVVNSTNPGGVDILRSQDQQLVGQSLQLINDGPLSLTPCRYGAPFQDVPASYVKEIHSGEFFDLSKLLPKNLSLHDEEDNLVLSLDNSVIKVSKKTKPSTSITDIEQWTTAFTMYLSVLTDKFPFRSQELLQYLSLIRYAARVHKGLGWVIYDYKFRQKASKNKSLLWSIVDSQLWLTIFTVPPAVLREEYPLFTKGPSSSSAISRGSNQGTCNTFNKFGSCTKYICKYKHTCNRCNGAHPGCDCPSLSKHREHEGDRGQDRDQGNSKSSSSRRHK